MTLVIGFHGGTSEQRIAIEAAHAALAVALPAAVGATQSAGGSFTRWFGGDPAARPAVAETLRAAAIALSWQSFTYDLEAKLAAPLVAGAPVLFVVIEPEGVTARLWDGYWPSYYLNRGPAARALAAAIAHELVVGFGERVVDLDGVVDARTAQALVASDPAVAAFCARNLMEFVSEFLPATGAPTPALAYGSDAGAAQRVCSVDAGPPLKALCFAGFGSTSGTFCMWLKVPADAAAGAALLTYVPPPSSGAPRLEVVNPRNVEIRIGAQSGGSTGAALADDVWRHLAITYEHVQPGTVVVSVFVDALLAWRSRALRSPRALAAGGDLYVGSDAGGVSRLTGLVSELQAYDELRDEVRIATGMLRRAVGGAPGLVLHWPLDVAPPGNPQSSFVASELRFRTGTATLSWSAVPDATGYEIEAGSTDGRWNAAQAVGAVTSHVLDGAPRARLGARVRARFGSGAGPWSGVVEITVFELAQTAVTLSWEAASAALVATWQDVPRRESFTLKLASSAGGSPVVTPGYGTLSYTLTAQIDSADAWRLDVRAFAAGSLGPAQPVPALDAPELGTVRYDLQAERLDVAWAAVSGAELYRLRIAPASGSQDPYGIVPSGSATSVSVTHAQYPLAVGTAYAVQLRALAAGAIGVRASVTIAVHAVSAPTLSWAAAATPELLEATWNAVTAGATYDVALYRSTSVDPIATRAGLATRVFSVAAWLDVDDVLAVRVRAVDGGVIGPPNAPSQPQVLAPTLHYLVEPATFAVTWSAAQPDAYLPIYRATETSPAQAPLRAGGSATLPAPVAGYPDGTAVTLRARGVVPGALGRIEPATVTVRVLTRPAASLRYDELLEAADATPRLLLSWPAINPPLTVAYDVEATVNGVARPVEHPTGLELDVTSLLDTAGTIAFAVRGNADGSIGPYSQAVAPAAPAWQSASYDVVTATIAAAWSAVADLGAVYVELAAATGTTPAVRRWLAADATTTDLPVAPSLAGQAVVLRVRSVRAAALSDRVALSMTLLDVPGPVLDPLTDTIDPKSIHAAWQFVVPAGTTAAGYVAELRKDGSVLQTKSVDAATRQATFDETGDVRFATGAVYGVRVRARVSPASGQTLVGQYSQEATINFGSDVDLALERLGATSDAAGAITVSWALARALPAATFEVQIPATSYGRTGLTGTLVTLARTDTKVELGKTYTVRLRAVYAAVSGPWSETTVRAGQVPVAPPSVTRDDPIEVRTGVLAQSGIDLLVPAVVPLAFAVTYRSDGQPPGPDPPLPLGPRWNHVYNARIQRASGERSVALVDGDLTVVVYDAPASTTGAYAQRGIPDASRLFVGADLEYTLTRADQSVAHFDATGALLWTSDPPGNRTTMTYADGRLRRVIDAGSGRWLELTYDAHSRITAVTSSGGADIGYEYDAAGHLKTYTDPEGHTRGFTYDGEGRMTGATDQLTRTCLRNVYDAQGRITLQQDARALQQQESYGTSFEYRDEADARVVVVTDRNGQVTTYRFDTASGTLREESVALGTDVVWRTRYTYDANANVLTRAVYEGPAGSDTGTWTWRYDYDGAGNVTRMTDPLGGVETADYDAALHPTAITNRIGNRFTLAWDGNLLTRVVDPLGRDIVLAYAPGPIRGLLRTLTDAYGAQRTYEHDEHGQLKRVVDATGAITLVTWDDGGWPSGVERRTKDDATVYAQVRSTNALGRVTQLRERYADQLDADAFTTDREYAATGTLSAIVDALRHRTAGGYDANLLLEQITYPTDTAPADRTIFGYDRGDRLTSVDHGAGVVEHFGDDALGRPILHRDPNGQAWTAAYAVVDAHLVQTVTLPLDDPDHAGVKLTRSVAIDPLGRIVVQKDTAGGETRIAYEAVDMKDTAGTKGLRIATTLPRTKPAQVTPYSRSETFDAVGRLVEVVDERGKRTLLAYARAATVPNPGAAAVAVTVTRPTGLVEILLLDGAGRIVEIRRGTAPDERRAQWTYDPLDRVVAAAETGPSAEASATCAYAYDDGSIKATVAAAGRDGPVLRWDGLGRLSAVKDRAGQTSTYTYTAAGSLQSSTNARLDRQDYGYDAAARLTSIVLADGAGTITHVLDLNGNRKQTLLDAVAQVEREFDPLDRLTSRTVAGQAVVYAYGALGGLATLTYPTDAGQDARQVQYCRDGLGRLTGVVDWAGRETSYGYLATGQLETSGAPNGLGEALGHDDDGRLTSIAATVDGLVVARAEYTYDAFDAPATVRELLPAPAKPAAGSRQLTYDGDRLVGVDGAALTYDDDGNVLTAPGIDGALAYNTFGELTAAGTTTLKHDADGLLLEVTTAAATTAFVHDPGGYANPSREQADRLRATAATDLAPLASGGSALSPLLRAPGSLGTAAPRTGLTEPPSALAATGPAWNVPLDALDRRLAARTHAGWTRYVYGVGLIGAELPDGSFVSSVFDAGGNALAAALADGTLADRQSYDAFGNIPGHDGGSGQRFGFAGRYGVTSDVPGLLSMRTRAYAPSLLRFTGQDFLLGGADDPQSLNRYAYAANAPLLRVDPLGEDAFPVWGIVLAVVGGALALGAIIGGAYAAAVGSAGVGGVTTIGGLGAGGLGAGGLGSSGLGAGEVVEIELQPLSREVIRRSGSGLRYRGARGTGSRGQAGRATSAREGRDPGGSGGQARYRPLREQGSPARDIELNDRARPSAVPRGQIGVPRIKAE